MRMSAKGVAFLAKWEGVKLKIYKDFAGFPTIGVGHRLTREELVGGKYDNGISKLEAATLLAEDLRPREELINSLVTAPLKQHEFDALVSLVYNIGAGAFRGSTLLKKLNALDYNAVPDQFRLWVRSGGKHCEGLVNRRNQEVALWEGIL